MPTSDVIKNEDATNSAQKEKKNGLLEKLRRPELALVALAGIMLGGALSPVVGLAAGTIAIGVAGGIAGERLVSKIAGSIRHAVKHMKANWSSHRDQVSEIEQEAVAHLHLLKTQPEIREQPLTSVARKQQPERNATVPEVDGSQLIVDGSGNLLFIGAELAEQGLDNVKPAHDNVAATNTQAINQDPGSKTNSQESEQDQLLRFTLPTAAAIRPGGVAKDKNKKGNDRGPKQNFWRLN